jgi:hypothetical protein
MNHPRGTCGAGHALAELGRFARHADLRGQARMSALTPSRGRRDRTGKAGSAAAARLRWFVRLTVALRLHGGLKR